MHDALLFALPPSPARVYRHTTSAVHEYEVNPPSSIPHLSIPLPLPSRNGDYEQSTQQFVDEDGGVQVVLSPSASGGVAREEACHPDPADDGHDSDSADDGAEVSRAAGNAQAPVWAPMFGQVGFCFACVGVFLVPSARQ